MIQSVGMIAKNAAQHMFCIIWIIMAMIAGHSLDTLWSEWSLYEMIKQSVLVCFSRKFPHNSFSSQHSAHWLPYLHDTCHCIFLQAFIFLALEMTLFLPCEESLWKASVNGISPFPLEHLTGVRIPHAITTTCKGGMDEIEPIQSSYPYTQEPVYSLLG